MPQAPIPHLKPLPEGDPRLRVAYMSASSECDRILMIKAVGLEMKTVTNEAIVVVVGV